MKHPNLPSTVRAALLALVAFLAAWQLDDFQLTAEAVGTSLLVALMGWLNPAAEPSDPRSRK